MRRTTWALATMFVASAIALELVVITESETKAANCTGDCSTTSSNVCMGSSPSSCTGCAPVGPTCVNGSKGYTNNMVYGTVPGSKIVALSKKVDCKEYYPCDTLAPEVGNCSYSLIFGWYCAPADVELCYKCKQLSAVVTDTYSSCVATDCDEGG